MVDGDGSLVAVGAQVEAGIAVVGVAQKRWAVVAGVVADSGAFHLDDVGTQIAEQLGCEGGGQDSAQVENPDAGQCTGGGHLRASFGSFSTRSAMMFFWISLAPA